MNNELLKKLNEFLIYHVKYQLKLYELSSVVNSKRYNGLSRWMQVQAQDEVLHQRKIINYLFDHEKEILVSRSSYNFEGEKENLKKDFRVEKVLLWMKEEKEKFLQDTERIIENASSAKDFDVVKFLDWFVIDFHQEIAELREIIDRLLLAGNNHYHWDKDLGKRKEPDTAKVIVPF